MSTCCYLLTEKGKYYLDKWDCFSEFEQITFYTEVEFLTILDECVLTQVGIWTDDDSLTVSDENRNPSLDEHSKRILIYRLEYLALARSLVGKKNLIVTDVDDDEVLKYEMIFRLIKEK